MQRWDIFCRIIDNHGDIGVTWRLARQLASEHGWVVRLWIDDMPAASKLIPALQLNLAIQDIDAVQIRRWEDADSAEPADVVIEAFACELPTTYLKRMTSDRSIWINLEYLSAEPWVEDFHAKESRHPTFPLTKHFYFPGFTSNTGGLLLERSLLARRDEFLASGGMQSAFQKRLGIPESDALKVSLFCYPHAPLHQLLDAFAISPEPVTCLVPESSSWPVLKRVLKAELQQGTPVRIGQLTVLPLPFLTQNDYDQLLWLCDINFVRGEDSWIRAIWAGKPFVWQPYRQEQKTHLEKLAAFLQVYDADLDTEAALALRQCHENWSSDAFPRTRWCNYLEQLATLEAHAQAFASKLATESDLASKLVIFVEKLRDNQV